MPPKSACSPFFIFAKNTNGNTARQIIPINKKAKGFNHCFNFNSLKV